MIWLHFNAVNDTKGIVDGVHNFPDMLDEDTKSTGILVESIPAPDNNDKLSTLCINPQTLELWYEYIDRPLTDAEVLQSRIEQLEADNATMTYALMMGGII